MAPLASGYVGSVRHPVAVAADGQVAMLNVTKIAFEYRVPATALFDVVVLRYVTGEAYAVVSRALYPRLGCVRVRVADRASGDAFAMRVRVAGPAVGSVSVLDVAEGAVQARMSATPVLDWLILHCVAVDAIDVRRLRIRATIRRGRSGFALLCRVGTTANGKHTYDHADE